MSVVLIGQCLCGPNRHAIAAVAGEVRNVAAVELVAERMLIELRDGVAALLRSACNPWCAICGADAAGWRYEIGRSRFKTMAEAAPALQAIAAENAVANAMLGSHGTKRPTRQ